jgi:hypothetical protein
MVSPDRMIAMRNAIVDGDVAKVRLLLKAGVPADGEVDRFPFLRVSAMLCQEEIFDLLLSHGASITPGFLDWAVDGGGGRLRPSIRIVQRTLSDVPHDAEALTRGLRFACVSGSVEVVQLLIERGADPNGVDDLHQDFPLSNAVSHGHAGIVQVLLDAGADPTQPVWNEDDGDLSETPSTLVDLAIQHGYPEIARLLG